MPSTRPKLFTIAERQAALLRYALAPRGMWLAAHTPTALPYPCRCPDGKPCDGAPWQGVKQCPCWGRGARASARCCETRRLRELSKMRDGAGE